MSVQLPMVHVTVHPDGAIVVRRGRIDPGTGSMLIGGLPILLDPSSLRVGVTGATLGRARLDLEFPDQDNRVQVAEEHDLAEVERQILLHDAEVAHLQGAQRYAQGLQPHYDTEAPPLTAASLTAWLQLDEACTAWSERLQARLSVLDHAHAELLAERQRLRNVLANLSTEAIWQRWAPTRSLAIDVHDAEAEVGLEVSYRVPGARWVPTYTLDLERSLERGQFTMRALIAQATGEDWRDVSVALSTAPCSRIVDLPEQRALRLGTVQAPPQTGWRPLPEDLDSLFPQAPVPLGAVSEDRTLLWDEAPKEAEEMTPPPAMEVHAKSASRLVMDPMPARSRRSQAAPAPAMPERSALAATVAPPAAFGGAAAPSPRKPRPTSLQAANEQLDYQNLRVHGPDAGLGRQGRLYALDPAATFEDRNLPPDAWSRWSHALSRLLEGTHDLLQRPLPTHQVVPGPVDGADVRFEAQGTLEVPSDGRFHVATLFTEPATATITYRAVPRADLRVFRQVEARTTRIEALPPGPLEASIAGSLEIVAPFSGASGADAVRFGLGAEDGLTLVRNVRYDEQSAGMLGGSRRFATHIAVDAASALPRPVSIELLERVPVPVEKDSPAFQLTHSSPPCERYEGAPGSTVLEGGQRQWLKLTPLGTARATLSYAVTLSNKEEVAGGDRRG